jgi:hypothetical protein
MLLSLQPQANLIIVKQLFPVSLCKAFPDGSAEAGCFFNGTQSYVLHPSLGVLPGVASDLRKLGFLFGREM